MTTNKTRNLEISYLSQNQTNKETLVNEALLKIDAILNNGAISISTTTPPESPEEGDLYIIPSSATGDWEGEDGKFTYFHSSKGWVILIPNEGMTLWVNEQNKLYTFDGENWITSGEFDNLTELGVNATPDSTNKFAVKSDAVLFDNDGSDSQIKVNKETASDTASHLFQTNYSGRAEFGLTGDDDFHIKVSSDGSTWNDSLIIDKSSGNILAKQNLTSEKSISGRINLGLPVELTISSGEVTLVDGTSNFKIRSEGASPTDDLVEINGGNEGDLITLGCLSGSEDITLIDTSSGSTGLRLSGNFVLDHPHDTITLIKNGDTWYEISRSNNR